MATRLLVCFISLATLGYGSLVPRLVNVHDNNNKQLGNSKVNINVDAHNMFGNNNDLIDRLPSGEPSDPSDAYQECWDFLTEYMPTRDEAMMSPILMNNTITFALLARNRFSYARSVPWDIFLNNVLPYFMMNEARDHWREYFYKRLAPIADQYTSYSNLSIWLANNLWTTKPINVSWQSDTTPLSMSPFEVLTYGFASCTGHSITIVAALRSIGIPSRVAGTIWNPDKNCSTTTMDDSSDDDNNNEESKNNSNNEQNEHIGSALDENHSWFEIYDENGFWSFCNANACKNGFNHTWFYPKDTRCQTSDNSNYTIYATSYQTTGLHYVLPWAFDDTSVNAYDVTSDYYNYSTSVNK